MTSTLTLKQSELIDEYLKVCYDNTIAKERFSYYSKEELKNYFGISEELATFLMVNIVEMKYNNLKIVDSEFPANGTLEDSWFTINDNTINFINADGFTGIYNYQVAEEEKWEKKEKLENDKLINDLNQYRFNKITVWIVIGLTFISLVFNILLGFKII